VNGAGGTFYLPPDDAGAVVCEKVFLGESGFGRECVRRRGGCGPQK